MASKLAVEQLPPGWTEALPPLVRSSLGLVPAIAGTSPVRVHDDGTERFRLFEVVADLLVLIAELGPVVVLLDDLQWADTGSVLYPGRDRSGTARRADPAGGVPARPGRPCCPDAAGPSWSMPADRSTCPARPVGGPDAART